MFKAEQAHSARIEALAQALDQQAQLDKERGDIAAKQAADMAALAEQVAALSAELAQLRANLEQSPSAAGDPEPGPAPDASVRGRA